MESENVNKIPYFNKVVSEMSALYARKNKDYGDSFGKSFKEYGLVVAAIRLEDKLNRLKSLLKLGNLQEIKNKQQVKEESIYDTLIDLANYSVMTLIELDLLKEERELEQAGMIAKENL